MVVGDGYAGKTTLIRLFLGKEFREDLPRTVGIDLRIISASLSEGGLFVKLPSLGIDKALVHSVSAIIKKDFQRKEPNIRVVWQGSVVDKLSIASRSLRTNLTRLDIPKTINSLLSEVINKADTTFTKQDITKLTLWDFGGQNM